MSRVCVWVDLRIGADKQQPWQQIHLALDAETLLNSLFGIGLHTRKNIFFRSSL